MTKKHKTGSMRMQQLVKKGYKPFLFLSFHFLFVGLLQAQTPANKPAASATQPPAVAAGFTPYQPGAYSAATTLNYVRTWEALAPSYLNDAAFSAAAAATDGYKHIKEATQYIDGLGRPLQTVTRQSTPGVNPMDMVAPMVYDEFGREQHKFLPYASPASDGKFRLNPFSEQKNFMQAQYPGEQVYYSKTNFEPSPLNRAEKTLAHGNSWVGNDRGVARQYLVNTAADAVRNWEIDNNDLLFDAVDITTNIPTSTTTYSAGELYKNVTIDEHGNAVV
jgi:hypothetical protein